jgi:hypothetical protein
MSFVFYLLIIAGLSLFETVSSIDNAIINAEVLSTMDQKSKKWFLFWGLLFAVFIVRGILPWGIVWLSTPSLGPLGALTATFSNDPQVLDAIKQSSPLLLIGGGTFLLFLFFNWLFLEPKNYALKSEKFFNDNAAWFYAVVSVVLTTIVWYALHTNPFMAFAASIGSSAFFITHGFKQHAQMQEQSLTRNHLSSLTKIFYLEMIDAAFSIDGVLGAFAFTLSVPLIFLGNGLGAIILRQLTVGNIERIKKYAYLENGAMYSVFFLGIIMLLNSFGIHIPEYVSPLMTFLIVGIFFLKSHKKLKNISHA